MKSKIKIEKIKVVLEKSKKLKGYSILLHQVQQNLDNGDDLETAMESAIKYCIEEDHIADFLKENGGRVMSILRQNLTEEQKKKLWKNEGLKEGREEDRVEEREKLTRSMKANGVAWEVIQKITGMSEAAIEAL